MAHTILIPDETRIRMATYLAELGRGDATPGQHLAKAIGDSDFSVMDESGFLDALLNTKIPQIFAESSVAGDGSDWNLTELGLLGDISVAVPVTVFDNGNHTVPALHEKPFPGTLVFTPGALLRNGKGKPPADRAEVIDRDEKFDPEGYYRLYERRLRPVFRHVDDTAADMGRSALITVPGLGCGQFAGPFAGQLGAALQSVLERFLHEHGGRFPRIRAVYYDPFKECANRRSQFHGISFLTRPLLQGNEAKSQLCHPVFYQEQGDDFSDCELFSIVAWDHVSWPGNDFFGGSRCTDDGVKSAATDSMFALTGIEGHYDPSSSSYLPPAPYRTWGEVVERNGLRL